MYSELTIRNHYPDGFLEVEPRQLHTLLPNPTLIHLNGRRREPLFVSILQHGNEITGLLAVQALLRRFRDRELPRALSLFIGNVAAARYGLRRLDHQPDFNRIWLPGERPEHAIMQQVIREMRQRDTFASVDIHNNTGQNPHYACINRLAQPFYHLAALFARTVVYFIRPAGVQSACFATFCPALTLECGHPGEPSGVTHCEQFLEAALNLAAIPNHPIAHGDIDLFHTVAVVTVPRDISFGFGATATDIQFIEDLERLNFSELLAGTVLGHINADKPVRLEVRDEQDCEVSRRYFSYEKGTIRTRTVVMPSMLTLDSQVIRQDCLCYLMERLHLPENPEG